MYLSYQDIKKLKIPLNSVAYADMLRYAYIQICTILDEVAILNKSAKSNMYLRDTLYIVSPALKAINKFSGIRRARNFMLAHFNRDKKGNFFPWWVALRETKLPRTQREINQLYAWLNLVTIILVTRYREDIEEISDQHRQEVDDYSKWAVLEENNASIKETPFDNIKDEIERRMNEIGVTQLIIDPDMKELVGYLRNKRN